ncbi:MAG TPA: hypothetical protein PK771_05535 [Spirochaetota bacterium]|nr:hypothetical protein [Spirochaetota bacterium]
MLKITYQSVLVFLIFMCLSCSSCSNEIDPNYLPTFDPIDVDENTVFMFSRKDDKVHKIYAIDTKNSKKIYTYEFKRKIIYSFEYDASFDMNPYILLNGGEVLKLEVKTGKVKRLDLQYAQASICITDNKLWINQYQGGSENTPKEYHIYDPKTDKIEKTTLPEGVYFGYAGSIDNSYYLPLYYGDGIPAKIYNLTTKRIISNNLLSKEYDVFYFELDNYLLASVPDSTKLDLYFINSIDPLFSYNYLFSVDAQETLLFAKMFEDDNYIYLVSREDIIKRNKNNNYAIEKIVSFDNKSSGGSGGTYCKNGYIWLTSENDDGAYKINMSDLSYEVVK